METDRAQIRKGLTHDQEPETNKNTQHRIKRRKIRESMKVKLFSLGLILVARGGEKKRICLAINTHEVHFLGNTI